MNSDYENLSASLLEYMQNSLSLNSSPDIELKDNDQENCDNPLGKTAYYSPSDKKITLYTKNRHVKDVLRSLAHEMIHYHQDVRGDLQGVYYEGEDYAQKDKHLREMEREAYEKGNMMFRDWEDSRKKMVNESSGNFERKKLEKTISRNKKLERMISDRNSRILKNNVKGILKDIKKDK